MSSTFNSYPSALTPLQLTATANILQNQGLRVNAEVISTVGTYEALPYVSNYLTMYTEAKSGTGGLANSTVRTLANIASSTCAALSDSIPQYYLNLGTFAGVSYAPGLSGIIKTKANQYMGNGDLSKFCQMFSTCDGYAGMCNTFIVSACNADKYLCTTFDDFNSMVTGDITNVNLATEAWGSDLANLGQLWNLNNLDNLGSPLALMQQITSIAGTVPIVSLTFVANGVPEEVVANLTDPGLTVTDTVQKAMYEGMKQVTGTYLQQILNILGVKTVGIETMADLLNPVKLFPNSFESLTTVTPNGPRAIYTNNQGAVNTNLVQVLPAYILNSAV